MEGGRDLIVEKRVLEGRSWPDCINVVHKER